MIAALILFSTANHHGAGMTMRLRTLNKVCDEHVWPCSLQTFLVRPEMSPMVIHGKKGGGNFYEMERLGH